MADKRSGQGDVKDPAQDGRLKDNRSNGTTRKNEDMKADSNGQGAVKDPEHDGRLKENRDSGTHMSDKNEDGRSKRSSN